MIFFSLYDVMPNSHVSPFINYHYYNFIFIVATNASELENIEAESPFCQDGRNKLSLGLLNLMYGFTLTSLVSTFI